MHDMPIGKAFETYTILTIGDGLVTQIPSVIVSIASALLLSKGGAHGSTDKALLGQLGGHPAALATVAGLLAIFALIPGLPLIPFMIGAVALGTSAWLSHRKKQAEIAKTNKAELVPAAAAPKKSLGDMLDLDEIHIEFASDIVPTVMDPATGLDARIVNMRNHIASTYGLIIPEIRLTDSPMLANGEYIIRIQGVEVAKSAIETDKVLVLLNDPSMPPPDGRDVKEPVYGAPARWIDPTQQEEASLLGLSVVTATEVVATHLLEVLKQNFARLFSRRTLRKLLDEFVTVSDPARAEANRRVLDELVPDKVPVDTLHAVLRLLLEERVSIRNLPLILESIAEVQGYLKGVEAITEHVRHRLGFQIVAELQEDDGALPLIQLSPDWEELFQKHQLDGESGAIDVALPPDDFNRLASSVAEKIGKASDNGRYPAVVTSTRRRRFLQTVLMSKGIRNPVFSFEEIGTNSKPALVGVA